MWPIAIESVLLYPTTAHASCRTCRELWIRCRGPPRQSVPCLLTQVRTGACRRPGLPRARLGAPVAMMALQQQPAEDEQARVAEVLEQAQQLESENQHEKAVQLLRQGLDELEREGGAGGSGLGARMLRKRLCVLQFSAGDYQGALQEARAVHEGLCREAGEGASETVLFGLRRGIVEAAAGEVGAGLQHISRAGEWLVPNLKRMVQLREEGGDDAPLADLAALKLAVSLSECNFYGALFTIHDLVQQGKADEVLRGWEMMETGVVRGFRDLSLVLPPGATSVRNALREHKRLQRLVEAVRAPPQLGELLREQAEQLRKVAELPRPGAAA